MAKRKIPDDPVSTLWPFKKGLKKVLGELEADIMSVIWKSSQGLTVRQVTDQLQEKKKVAYTSVMTVMGILVEKRLLSVDKSKQAYTYFAIQNQEEFTQKVVNKVLESFLSDFEEPVLQFFSQKTLSPEKLKMLEEKLKAQEDN